jgi:folylpolyglutamate synthase
VRYTLPSHIGSNGKIGLAGNHQRQNASLAVYLAHSLLQRIDPIRFPSGSSPIPFSNFFIKGLQGTRWPGRCQEVRDTNSPGMTWFLDGAHTVESLICGMEWFTSPGVGVKPDTAQFVVRIC